MSAKVPQELKRAIEKEVSRNVQVSVISETTFDLTTAYSKESMDFETTGILAHILRGAQNPRGDNILKAPWNLEICPTSLCSFQCNFCSYTMRNRKNRGKENTRSLQRDVVTSILNDAKAGGTFGLFFSGGGDPLNYQGIDEVIEYAAEFAEVSVQTNGYLLDQTILNRGRQWLNDNIDLVSISIYGHSQEQYDKIGKMPHNAFERIRDNIQKLVRMKDRIRINCKILICRENWQSVFDIYEFVSDLGVDSYHLRPVNNYEPDQDVEMTLNEYRILQAKLKSTKDDSLCTFYRFIDGKINYLRQHPEADKCPCYTTKEGQVAIVETDGEVYPCVPSDGYLQYSIGNVNQDRFKNIWGGSRHFRVMKKLTNVFKCEIDKCRHAKINNAIDAYINGKRQLSQDVLNLNDESFKKRLRGQL